MERTCHEAACIPEVTLDAFRMGRCHHFQCTNSIWQHAITSETFLDTTGGLWFNGKLANKVVSAMTSAQNAHGGQEATLLSLYTTMYHWGAIVATPGYTDPAIFGAGGNPYGTSVTVDQDGKMIEDVQAAVKHQAKRTVTVAEWVKKGLQ